MAWTAHADPEQLIERNEAIESVTEKAQQIADLIRKAKHFCVFTGAGISTAAGIPDYRGPEGVWTLAATGGKRTKPVVGTLKAMPTPTHMALVKLQDEGLLKLLISQNCDGIHRKTGIKPSRIAELHGNTNLEKCSKCGKEYIRDFDATASYAVSVKDHKTGRICSVPGYLSSVFFDPTCMFVLCTNITISRCYGELEDSIVNFGESLPEKVIGYAWENTEQCDFMLVLGSSLTVSPACWMPKKVGTNETLAICNLQKTPLDRLSKIRVFTKTDDLMIAIMKELGLEIPPFILKRLLRVNYEKKGDKIALTVTGIDDTNIAATFMEGVEYLKDDKTKVALKQRRDDFVLEVKCPAEDSIKIKLYFMGHYNEPALILDIPIKDKDYLVAYPLAYNPLTGKWVVNEVIPQEKMPTLKPAKVKQTKEELEEKMKKVAQLGNLVSWPGALQTSGDGPEKCSGASMTYIDGKVYVFGGYFENSQEKKYYGDLRILDLSTMSWALCKSTEETPCARSGHSAVAINKKLYIFGGSCCFKPRENDERYFNDVHVFDSTTSTWEKMKCDGDIPAPRSFQSVFTKDHKIYIFGGSTIVPEDFFDDLLCLDTSTYILVFDRDNRLLTLF